MIYKIGSRDSKLAVAQSHLICNRILQTAPGLSLSLITMKTTGDLILHKTLDEIGGKGLFVKELDMALEQGRIHLAVHSLKDMPMEVAPHIPIVAYSAREDVRDVLVLRQGLSELPHNPVIGTSSKRRSLQGACLLQGARFENIRGNIKTRLEKLDSGAYDGLILAAAGLKRLDLSHRIHRYFTVDEMLPSAGQGILAVQARADFQPSWLAQIGDTTSAMMAAAERAFVRTLDGGCTSPTAACATVNGQTLVLKGLYYRETDGKWIKGQMEGPVSQAEGLGCQLATELKGQI